ncbi:phospholipid scramblase 4-like [Otolemur garnettii]|uniref:phospholipid scramblase 4-like n=1 Tax=Otolemur garnettii TaxID=30611 RepID=UPI000C7F0F26|nr:phospholipid scramblase 4-like [Otolemur garnettii]
MSGVVPTAPEQPAAEMENQVKYPDPRPEAPPEYNSHFVAGPPGPAVPPPAGYPGGLPMGYYSPQQPSTFPLGQPTTRANPIQYQPGKYPMPNLDNIHVFQHFEPLEMVTRFETNNRYDIKNNSDQMVYIVTEDTDDFTRNAYRTLRPLEVQCPPGVTLGFVAEHWNLCRAVYSIQNEKKENVMRVRGPCSTYGCGSDSVFEIKSLDGVSTIGSIIRKWNGLLSAMADADHFDIRFPMDLDVKMKAMIFGACFLIDFMYFERSPPQRSSR